MYNNPSYSFVIKLNIVSPEGKFVALPLVLNTYILREEDTPKIRMTNQL